MAKIFPNLRLPIKLSTSIPEMATRRAIRNLEDWLHDFGRQAALIGATASGGAFPGGGVVGGGGVGSVVNTVTAGSTRITAIPTTGNVVIDSPLFTSSVGGSVSPSGGGTINYLNANNAWSIPSGLLSGSAQTFTSTGIQTVTLNANTTVLRFNGASQIDLVGLTAGADGRVVFLQNISTGPNVRIYEENTNASPANRFILADNLTGGWLVNSGGMAVAIYNGAAQRWNVAWLLGFYAPDGFSSLGSITAQSLGANPGQLFVNDSAYLNMTAGTTGIGTAPTTAKLEIGGVGSAVPGIHVTPGTGGTAGIKVDNALTGQTVGQREIQTGDTGTYDTTAGAITAAGAIFTTDGTRSTGANDLINRALFVRAANGQKNYAIIVQGGFVGIGTLTPTAQLHLDSGDTWLHSTSGNTAIGTGAPVPGQKLTVAADTNGFAIFASNTRTGQVTSNRVIQGDQNGTWDTTAGLIQATAVQGRSLGTRSAGANTLENYGGVFTATGGQVNVGLQTNDGDVRLNTISGNACVGATDTSLAKFRVDAATTPAIRTDMHPTAQASDGRGVHIVSSGTWDATASAREVQGVRSSVTGTRSAGTNNLTNTALYGTATSAQVNQALVTDDGSNYLNRLSGNTGIGVTYSANQKLIVANESGKNATVSQTTVTDNSADVILLHADGTLASFQLNADKKLYGVRAEAMAAGAGGGGGGAPHSGTGGLMTNYGVWARALNGSNNHAIWVDDGQVTIRQQMAQNNNSWGLQIQPTMGATARVANYSGIDDQIACGADTTSGALQMTGGGFVVASIRTAGPNPLTNMALYATALNGQINIALQTDQGDVNLNAVSGNTTVHGELVATMGSVFMLMGA